MSVFILRIHKMAVQLHEFIGEFGITEMTVSERVFEILLQDSNMLLGLDNDEDKAATQMTLYIAGQPIVVRKAKRPERGSGSPDMEPKSEANPDHPQRGNAHRGSSFDDYLIESLKDEELARHFLRNTVGGTDPFYFILDACELVLKAHRPEI